ncbi:MAG TPA: hypothetical protein PLQ97_02330 [Myxococcota bacterium]|nr:hypothetical protein [Myxococcota bacterium]HQK50275.1 hypothetical protein [Myxococcota bacterium]
MLRRRTLALWLVLGGLLTVLSCVVVRHLQKGLLVRTEQRIAGIRPAADRLVEQRLLRQAFLGSALARGRLAAILEFLEESRGDFLQAWRKAEEAGPAGSAPEVRERRQEAVAAFRRGGAPVVDMTSERLADALAEHFGTRAFGEQGREGFVANEKAHLVQCLSVEPSFCSWDYTYATLMEELADLSRDWKLPVGCRVLVVDGHGTGLADSRKDGWSNVPGFCDSLPFCRGALESRSPRRDVMQLDGTWHLGTAVPILSRDHLIGAILILDPFNHDLVKEDASILGTEVAYSVKGAAVEFTPPLSSPETVRRVLQGGPTSSSFIASSFPLFGIPQSSEATMLVAVSRDVLSAPFQTARQVLISLGLLALLLGFALFFLIIEKYLQQIEGLYQGVHEVIHGNADYRFPTDMKDETLRNLGMTLNVMGLLAQGRPLVDEEEDALPDPWIGAASWESLDSATDTLESALAGADESVEELQVDIGALAAEPAESYHRRLFQEFLGAHREAGLPPPAVSQEDFLTRVVHLEQKLRRRYGVPQVRFIVSRKRGQVVLTPVRIRSPRES